MRHSSLHAGLPAYLEKGRHERAKLLIVLTKHDLGCDHLPDPEDVWRRLSGITDLIWGSCGQASRKHLELYRK